MVRLQSEQDNVSLPGAYTSTRTESQQKVIRRGANAGKGASTER